MIITCSFSPCLVWQALGLNKVTSGTFIRLHVVLWWRTRKHAHALQREEKKLRCRGAQCKFSSTWRWRVHHVGHDDKVWIVILCYQTIASKFKSCFGNTPTNLCILCHLDNIKWLKFALYIRIFIDQFSHVNNNNPYTHLTWENAIIFSTINMTLQCLRRQQCGKLLSSSTRNNIQQWN